MEKLVSALTDYVELLTLGALFLLIPAISFQVPLIEYVPNIFKQAPGENQPEPNNDVENRKPIPWILSYVILFVVLFSSGLLVNAAAYWVLQPAHIHIVDAVVRHTPWGATQNPELKSDWTFLVRPFPFCRTPPGDEYKNYYLDGAKQAQWQIRSPESFVTYSGSVLERSIRLVRGVITLIPLFVLLNLMGLVVLIPRIRSWLKIDDGVKKVKRVGYHFFCIAAGLSLYYILMQSYWWLEALSHREVWAAAEWLPK